MVPLRADLCFALGVGDHAGLAGVLLLRDFDGDFDGESSSSLEEETREFSRLIGDRLYARLFGDRVIEREACCWWNRIGLEGEVRKTGAVVGFGGGKEDEAATFSSPAPTDPAAEAAAAAAAAVSISICLVIAAVCIREAALVAPPPALGRLEVAAFLTEFRNLFHLLFLACGGLLLLFAGESFSPPSYHYSSILVFFFFGRLRCVVYVRRLRRGGQEEGGRRR